MSAGEIEGVDQTSAPRCVTSPSGARPESKWWITEAGNSLTTSTVSRKRRMPAPSLNTWISIPSPIAPKT